MGNIFRMATSQAIEDILREKAVQGHFGIMMTEDSLAEAIGRVVDLFEMTLALRGQTTPSASPPPPEPSPSVRNTLQGATSAGRARTRDWVRETGGIPQTKAASEVVWNSSPPTALSMPPPSVPEGQLPLGLPRKRVLLSTEEKEKLQKNGHTNVTKK